MSSRESVRHRLSVLLRQVRLRLEELFDHAWAVVPSQPVLNSFLFLGTLAVIFIDTQPIAFGELGIGNWVFHAWCLLGVAGPLGVIAARQLILHGRGRRRLFGFWLRTAADIMQCVALTAYLAARLLTTFDDALIYSLVVIAGVWVLQALWVVRDVWALVLIERTATRLNAIVYERR